MEVLSFSLGFQGLCFLDTLILFQFLPGCHHVVIHVHVARLDADELNQSNTLKIRISNTSLQFIDN